MLSPVWFGLLFMLSETALLMGRRAGGGTTASDQGSLRWFWLVIPLAMLVGFGVGIAVPWSRFPHYRAWATAGEALVLAGLAWRWYAIVYLGRWFTVNVAVAADQPLVDRGPYRHLRHPSYTGALLAILGLGLCMGSALALGLTLAMVLPVFLHRIRIEESVLAQAFGARWQAYAARTWRLLPGLY